MLEELKRIALQAGEIILSARGEKDVCEKTGLRDLVTKYDKLVEVFLREKLLAVLPEAGFMGEESMHQENWEAWEWLFVVDPIDGTTNFVQGFANSAVSIGLLHHGKVQYGVVFNPYADELYWAERGKGAFLNGSPIRCGDRDLTHSLLMFGSALYYPELQKRTLRIFEKAFPVVQDIRRFGSAALDLCYVASGKGGVFFEARLCPWDYAAGSLIAEEAGAVVSSMEGGALDLYRKCSVLAGCPTAQRQLLELIAACEETEEAT